MKEGKRRNEEKKKKEEKIEKKNYRQICNKLYEDTETQLSK